MFDVGSVRELLGLPNPSAAKIPASLAKPERNPLIGDRWGYELANREIGRQATAVGVGDRGSNPASSSMRPRTFGLPHRARRCRNSVALAGLDRWFESAFLQRRDREHSVSHTGLEGAATLLRSRGWTDGSNPLSSSGESDELPPEQARSRRISRLSAIGISRRPRGPSSTTGQDGRHHARPRQERWLTPGRGGKSEVSRRSGRCNPVPSGAGAESHRRLDAVLLYIEARARKFAVVMLRSNHEYRGARHQEATVTRGVSEDRGGRVNRVFGFSALVADFDDVALRGLGNCARCGVGHY